MDAPHDDKDGDSKPSPAQARGVHGRSSHQIGGLSPLDYEFQLERWEGEGGQSRPPDDEPRRQAWEGAAASS